MKRVSLPIEAYGLLQDLPKRTFPLDFVLVDSVLGGIPSKLCARRVVKCYDVDLVYTLTLTDHPNNNKILQLALDSRILEPSQNGINTETVDADSLETVLGMGLDVAHCCVTHYNYIKNHADFRLLAEIPSLAIRLPCHGRSLHLKTKISKTTQLTLAVDADEFTQFFAWATESHAHLEHLELDNVFTATVPPFAFPCLKTFHCAHAQPDAFWSQLLLAPNLEAIYTSKLPAKFKQLGASNPFLAIKPYRQLHPGPMMQMLNEFDKYV